MSKDKGLLEKRFRELLEEEDEIWNMEQVTLILDEAKKEYLKNCHPKLPCGCDECKWFKKWFGNP